MSENPVQKVLNQVKNLGLPQEKIKDFLIKVKSVLAIEGENTSFILEVLTKQIQGKATKQELSQANKKLQELLKTIGIGTFILLPFSVFTIPLLVKLSEQFNIEILPKSIKENMK